MQRLRLLPLALAAIVFGTAVPVEWRAALLEPPNLDAADFGINLLLYAPLGLALWRRPLVAPLTAAALLSGGIEILQMWSFERSCSPVDVLANTLSAGLGAAAGRGLARRRGLQPGLLPLQPGVIAAALLGAVLLFAAWAAWPAKPSSLESWDGGFDLLLGNEGTSDRPWRGRLDALALLPAALSHAELDELADLADPAVRAELVGRGAHLLAAPLTLHGGEARRIEAAATRRFFAQAVAHDAFTLIARLSTADIAQTGPARVISFSRDPFNRNFDLGQQGARLVFRIRSATTGPNGMNPRTETPTVLVAGRPVTVAASFDGSVARIFVDGQARGRKNLAAAGCLLPNLCDSDLPIASALFGACLAAVALGLGWPRSRRRAMALALLAGAAAAALLRALQVSQQVPPFESWALLMVLAGAACVGLAWVGPEPALQRPRSGGADVPRRRRTRPQNRLGSMAWTTGKAGSSGSTAAAPSPT